MTFSWHNLEKEKTKFHKEFTVSEAGKLAGLSATVPKSLCITIWLHDVRNYTVTKIFVNTSQIYISGSCWLRKNTSIFKALFQSAGW